MEVDENGVPVFSDTKISDDSETVELREPTTYSEPTRDVISRKEFEEQLKQEAALELDEIEYKLQIISPENNETIRDNAGNLTITVEITPPPAIGHKAQLLMNGSPVRDLNGGGAVQLTSVDRGSHQLSLRITNSKGKVLATSKPTQMTLHRFSRLHGGN